MLFWIFFGFFTLLFLISFCRERRLFRNAVFFTLALPNLILGIIDSSGGSILGFALVLLLFLVLPVCIVLISFVFVAAGILSIKREGFTVSHTLSIIFGLGIWGMFFAMIALFANRRLSTLEYGLLFLVLLAAAYILFTFTALFLYSLFYQLLPKSRHCDFIIVHGAGLIGGFRVSPLLAKRLDKGIQVFEHTGKAAKIIVSGGQGGDEKRPEAQAMKEYLIEHGIDESDILLEDKSTTTMENIRFSKQIMDERMEKYRCIFVTNDYHVFRTGTCARKAGLKADGVGCKTAFYYWPNAFIREYIAVILQYKILPVLTLILWAVGMVVAHWF